MKRKDWRWVGDKELRLHGPDGATQAIVRKQGSARNGFLWFLYAFDGSPVLAGVDRDQHVYRTDKRGAQAVAEAYVDGREVYP